jgi:hypothetical protein
MPQINGRRRTITPSRNAGRERHTRPRTSRHIGLVREDGGVQSGWRRWMQSTAGQVVIALVAAAVLMTLCLVYLELVDKPLRSRAGE